MVLTDVMRPWTPETPPVVVIGMHRSGTTMLTQVLRDLGVNMGVRREVNEESLLYLRLNEWLLAQAGGSWFTPSAFVDAMDSEVFVRLAEENVRGVLASPASLEHHGARPSSLWGFKDPRTTITWPLWRRVYPDARLVLVRRDGLAVASSLAVRAKRLLSGGLALPSARLRFRTPRADIRYAWAAHDVNQGLDIWAQYCECEDAIAEVDPTATRFRYEDVLDDPASAVDHLIETLDLRPSSEARATAAARIGRPRMRAGLPPGLDVGRAIPLLAQHGYPLE